MKKILVVEDDRKIAVALAVRLRSAGYEVVAAYDAIMAPSVARKQRPDLILMDISMPGGDGISVAERIQSMVDTAGTPMIFLTASKNPNLKERAMNAGAIGYFEKPYDADELLDAIVAAIGSGQPQDGEQTLAPEAV